LIAVLLTACGGKEEPAPAPEPVVVEAQQEMEMPEPAVEAPAPVEEPAEAPSLPAPAQPEQPAPAASGSAYTAPENLFTLDIPVGWAYTKDTEVIDDTVVETFTSTDGHAFVQVVVNESGIEVSNVEKGQITLDFMKRLYGSDLRVATDVTMDDGRERLEWWSDASATNGTTFFHRIRNYLFFYTTAYEDAYENDYESILDDVNNSYTVPEE